MSHIAQQLRERAEEIRLASPEEVAVDLLKQAGFNEEDARIKVAQEIMEKEAANQLVAFSGVDIEHAVALVKAANINIGELVNFSPKAEIDPTIELLQKAAQYIEAVEAELEDKKEAIEKIAQEKAIEAVKLPETIEKVASSGAFTNEDLAALKAMNPELLEKIASNINDEPWEMGRGTGFARPKTDPLLEFILN
jgi:hypothetical protein